MITNQEALSQYEKETITIPTHTQHCHERVRQTPQLDPISTATERTGELKLSTKESNRHIAQR